MKKQKNKQAKKASKLAKAENLKQKTITVKNAEGEPDTEAVVLVQNKIEDGDTVLTHCNAGALACVDYGLPQTRNRAIIFARRIEDGEFCFKAELVKQNFNRISKRKCSLQYFKTTLEILAKEVDENFTYQKKLNLQFFLMALQILNLNLKSIY